MFWLWAFYKYLELDGERCWCVTSDKDIWWSNDVGETCESTPISCNPHPSPCMHWYHFLSAQRHYQLPCLLHLHTRFPPSPAALAFWKVGKEGKEAGFGDSCRWKDGKGDIGREEAPCCLQSFRIKSQTVLNIDKSNQQCAKNQFFCSLHVDVISTSFQLMHNHFSSGKNRNIVLWDVLQDSLLYSMYILYLHCFIKQSH